MPPYQVLQLLFNFQLSTLNFRSLVALDVTRTSDGRCRIKSTDGSISAEN